MADFVAVIRRAVDGLSDNTPEMRVKVYARARGAVQRQLESMKPRPPETMLQRQLEKLEAAIRDVEAEHAEALPSAEASAFEAEAAPHEEAAAEPYHQPEALQEHEAAVEPESAALGPEPVDVAPVENAAEPVAPVASGEAWDENEDWQAEQHPAPAAVEPEPVAYHDIEALLPTGQNVVYEAPPEPVQPEFSQERPASYGYSIDEVHHQMAEVTQEVASAIPSDHFIEETHHEPLHADGAAHFGEVWVDHAAPAVEEPAHADHVWAAPEADPVLADHRAPDPYYEEVAQVKMPEANERFAWDATAFDELPAVEPAKPVKPAPAGDFDDVDLFADVHGQASSSAPVAAKANVQADDGWSEITELAGYEKFAAEADFGAPVPPDLDQVAVNKLQGRSYRMEPKRRRFGVVGILLTLLGIAVVGGAGYAAWLNRVTLNNMVAGLVSSATKNASVAQKATPPATTAPATATAPAATTTPPKTDTASAQPTPVKPANTNAAALDTDTNTVSNKFTQRLLANGTEVDAGSPPPPGAPLPAEGKSIAQQNVAAAPAPAAAAPTTAPVPPATTPALTPPVAAAPLTPAPTIPAAPTPDAAAPTPAPATPVATATPTPAAPVQTATATAPAASPTPPPVAQTATTGSPEKMFLYEERLGQTSPTAIEGSVTWSAVEDKGDDGRPAPTIQGSINVPERGMTAMITLKRNTDPSLPASHLIEIVFSLPPNFEGGTIDSVQRVAMKATEQDRGDPLIAVPAKITDDFHMVALNDFPDARKTNLELLRTRDWIDIPVTYRNGRRALLTMQKGKTGNDVFNKVIGEWAALGGDTAAAQ